MYKEDDYKFAYERMAVAGIREHFGDNDLSDDQLRKYLVSEESTESSSHACGVDLQEVFNFAQGYVPTVLRILLEQAFPDAPSVGGARIAITDQKTLESLVATFMIRGITLGIMLKDPELGNEPDLVDRVNALKLEAIDQ